MLRHLRSSGSPYTVIAVFVLSGLANCGVAEKGAPTSDGAGRGGQAGTQPHNGQGGDESQGGDSNQTGGSPATAGGSGGSSPIPSQSGGEPGETGAGGTMAGEGGANLGGYAGADPSEAGAAGESGASSGGTSPTGSGGRTSVGGSQNNLGGSPTHMGGSGGRSNAGGGSGGRTSTGGGGQINASGGTGGTSAECSLNVHCTNASRPYCSPQGRCVECLSEGQCPAPAGECLNRSCSNNQCAEVPKAAGAACGDRTSSACSSPDTCDGKGKCGANHAPADTACDDGLYCNGSDRCNASGECAHAGSPCTAPLVCDALSKSCRCANAGRQVANYCSSDPSQTEALDRQAAATADSACAACGGYNRLNDGGGCTRFVCKG